MQYCIVARTGFRISEIRVGTWGTGGNMWGKTDDRESGNALNLAIDLGVNFIDTALTYGNGHSECIIGEVLKTESEKMYVATKIPPKNGKWPARKGTGLRDAFPRSHIIDCTDRSLKNLDVDATGLQQFYVWEDEWASDPECQEPSCGLKIRVKSSQWGSRRMITSLATGFLLQWRRMRP